MNQIENFPQEIVDKMLYYQVQQGNNKDISVFEICKEADFDDGGFDWNKTPEENDFWFKVIEYCNFDLFFKKYPKDTSKDKELIPSQVKEIVVAEDYIIFFGTKVPIEVVISSVQIHKKLVSM